MLVILPTVCGDKGSAKSALSQFADDVVATVEDCANHW
jgi:hypothetical protein